MKYLILLIFFVFINSCTKNDSWLTIVYQSTSKKFQYTEAVSYTLDECKKKGQKALIDNDLKGKGLFQCGYNCSYEYQATILVCEQVITEN